MLTGSISFFYSTMKSICLCRLSHFCSNISTRFTMPGVFGFESTYTSDTIAVNNAITPNVTAKFSSFSIIRYFDFTIFPYTKKAALLAGIPLARKRDSVSLHRPSKKRFEIYIAYSVPSATAWAMPCSGSCIWSILCEATVAIQRLNGSAFAEGTD